MLEKDLLKVAMTTLNPVDKSSSEKSQGLGLVEHSYTEKANGSVIYAGLEINTQMVWYHDFTYLLLTLNGIWKICMILNGIMWKM